MTTVVRVRAGWAVALLLIGALGFAASFRGVVPVLVVVALVFIAWAALTLIRRRRRKPRAATA